MTLILFILVVALAVAFLLRNSTPSGTPILAQHLALGCLLVLAAALALMPDPAYADLGKDIFKPGGAVGKQIVPFFQDVFAGAQWLGYGCAGIGGTVCATQAMGGRPPTQKAIAIGGGAMGVGVTGTAVNALLGTGGGDITGAVKSGG